MKILYNAIQTPDGTILESFRNSDRINIPAHNDNNGYTYRVHGGENYIGRTHDNNAPEPIELTVYDDGSFDKRREYLHWGNKFDKDNKQLPKVKFIPIKDLDTDHIKAILNTQLSIRPEFKDTMEKELVWRVRDNNITDILNG